MISRALNFARALSPQTWGVLALLVAASFASGSATGWTVRAWKCEAARTAAVETAAADARENSAAVITDLLSQQTRGDAADRAVAHAQARTDGIFRGLEARVEALVGATGRPPAGSDCPGAAGEWVQLWNAANAGTDAPTETPGPAGAPDPAVRGPPAAGDGHPEHD